MKIPLLALATATLLAPAYNVNAQDTTSERGKLSYALGYRAGVDIARIIKSGESLDMATLQKGLQDAANGKNLAVPAEQLTAALENLQKRMVANAKAALEKRAADNKTKSDVFLAQNRNTAGVKVLPSGVQYRVIAAGSGPRPTQGNQITVTFLSTLPNGQVISDTSIASDGIPAGPVTVRLSEIPLPGLREALQMMREGARWEVAIPGMHAYGTSIDRAGEMANQAVIYNITLTKVGPVIAAPKTGG